MGRGDGAEEKQDNEYEGDDDDIIIGAVFRGTNFVQIQENGTMKVISGHARQPSMYDIEFCPESDSDEERDGRAVGLDLMGSDSKDEG